ncbi:MAG: hypothetical protein NC395_11070 [Prevotella sp.]|nr:hypothetical protein [Prevotella sp.]
MNIITQKMKFRQSLMKCAAKYGVSKASRKYNKTRPEARNKRLRDV